MGMNQSQRRGNYPDLAASLALTVLELDDFPPPTFVAMSLGIYVLTYPDFITQKPILVIILTVHMKFYMCWGVGEYSLSISFLRPIHGHLLMYRI